MTDETVSHIKMEFNRRATHIVEWLALGQETLRQAQVWQTQQQETLTAAALADWLRDNGGQRDRADGPAIIETRANGTRCEAWYSKGKFVKEDIVASLSAIPGITLYPPAP